MAYFGRLLTAMVTPFKEDLTIDYSEAARLAEFLVQNGSDGIVVAGTTGEAATLSQEEKCQLFKTVVEAVGDRVKVLAGTGSNDTATTVKLTAEAEKAGVHGIMVVAPYYNKPPQQALLKHYQEIAANTTLPIMIYNVPGRTATNITPQTTVALSEIANIVAVKEASGNLDQVSEIIRCVREDFCVYSGDDSLTLPMLAVGCCGVVSVASHVIGPSMKKMIEAFFKCNFTEAKEIHLKLFPVFKGLFITTSPIPVKTVLNLLGHKMGSFRLPLCEASEQEKQFLTQLCQQIKNNCYL